MTDKTQTNTNEDSNVKPKKPHQRVLLVNQTLTSWLRTTKILHNQLEKNQKNLAKEMQAFNNHLRLAYVKQEGIK